MNETRTLTRNAAIHRCCLAEKRSRRDSEFQGLDLIETTLRADEAYRKALPELVGYENIRDFIACVTYGLANDTITALRGTKLLACAQLALRTLRQESPTVRKNKKTGPNDTTDQASASVKALENTPVSSSIY